MDSGITNTSYSKIYKMDMDYQLLKVMPDQVDEIHEILRACGLDMKTRFGFGHWVHPYPIHLLREAAKEKSVYAVRDGGQTLATFTIGTQPPGYYDINIWKSPNGKAVYVNRLAVLPIFQGKGIGAWCMNKIERIAEETGCASVRLDCIENHIRQHNFYERLGYHRKGIVRFRDDTLVCFEKGLPV